MCRRGLANEIEQITSSGAKTMDVLGAALTADEVDHILARVDRIGTAAKSTPDFQLIVDTDLDLHHAKGVVSLFCFAAGFFVSKHLFSTDDAAQRAEAAVFGRQQVHDASKNDAATLSDADRHFARHTGST